MNYMVSIMLFLSAWNAYAEEIFPPGCTPLVVSGELVELPATKSTVTMIHNLSNTDLWVTHPVSEPNTSAGWSSRLQAGNWSALALSEDAFELSCIESSPGHEQQTPCSAVLAVCLWSAAIMPEKSSGTYWAAEDMPLSSLIAYIKRRGFVFSEKGARPQQ
jgi:hypothetical protein